MLSKLRTVLEDKLTVLIQRLFESFSINLAEVLLGKIMYLCGSLNILEGVLMEVCDRFLLCILNFANCIKGLGKKGL